MQGADAMHVVEQQGLGTAHQLDDPAEAQRAQSPDDVDGIQLTERYVQKDDVGLTSIQRRDGLLRRMQALGCQTQHAKRRRDVFADALLVVDDEGVGARVRKPFGRRRGSVRLAAPMRLMWKRTVLGFEHGETSVLRIVPPLLVTPLPVKVGLMIIAQCNSHPLLSVRRSYNHMVRHRISDRVGKAHSSDQDGRITPLPVVWVSNRR